MRRMTLLVFITATASFAWSQTKITVKGCIKNLPSAKVYLTGFYGEKVTFQDSATVSDHCFHFTLPDTLKGMYSIMFDKVNNGFMQLIMNGEDIEFHSVYPSLLDSMAFTRSKENKIFYEYAKAISHNSQQKEQWVKLSSSYLPGNPIQKKIQAEIKNLELDSIKITKDLLTRNPNNLSTGYLRMQQAIMVPVTYKGDKNVYLRQHYLDNIDFENTNLLHSNTFIPTIIKYIELFENPAYTFSEQTDNLAIALDGLLEKASTNPVMYNFILTDMGNRFRYGNYDIIGAYLTHYYTGKKIPLNSYAASDVHARLNALAHPTIGRIAPDISMPTYDGGSLKLSGIQSEYLLLVFWSSTCYHCTETLPLLKRVYDAKRGSLEVLAISFDTDQNEWQNFVKKNNLGWINYSDLKGWQSEIAKSYDIQGTPTYILLNREKMIILKPAVFEELVLKLRALNLI